MSNVVISGANRGIGLELCRHYLDTGSQVFALCRQASPELRESKATVIENIDLCHRSGGIPRRITVAGCTGSRSHKQRGNP